MLITEEGLTFRRVMSCWVCVDYPELRMLTDGSYTIAGQQRLFRTAREALAAARRARVEPQKILARVADAVSR